MHLYIYIEIYLDVYVHAYMYTFASAHPYIDHEIALPWAAEATILNSSTFGASMLRYVCCFMYMYMC